SIRAVGAARFSRVRPGPDEIVRVDEGTIHLDVAPLGVGDRFRVVTADAEVEVRGTAFQVTAAASQLVAVRVWHGRVEVPGGGGVAGGLGAGGEGVRSAAAAPATVLGAAVPPPPAPRSRAPRLHARLPAKAAAARASADVSIDASGDASFDAAWALL